MPIYDFRCNDCNKTFELLVKTSTVPACPACASHRNWKNGVGTGAAKPAQGHRFQVPGRERTAKDISALQTIGAAA